MRNALPILLSLFLFTACRNISGSGNIVTEKRNTGNFTGIDAGGAYDVELKAGPEAKVEVEADDNIQQYIETNVSGDVLEISTRGRSNFRNSHIKIFVTASEIKLLKVSGAASINAVTTIKAPDKIRLEASGAAHINVMIDAPTISSHASGAANIEISGRTRNHNTHASGSADIRAYQLLSENTEAEASGAANIKVHASVLLDATASGAADISYKGGAVVKEHVSGAASIKKQE